MTFHHHSSLVYELLLCDCQRFVMNLALLIANDQFSWFLPLVLFEYSHLMDGLNCLFNWKRIITTTPWTKSSLSRKAFNVKHLPQVLSCVWKKKKTAIWKPLDDFELLFDWRLSCENWQFGRNGIGLPHAGSHSRISLCWGQQQRDRDSLWHRDLTGVLPGRCGRMWISCPCETRAEGGGREVTLHCM